MASSNLSFSQSLSNSLIVHQYRYEQRQKKHEVNHHHHNHHNQHHQQQQQPLLYQHHQDDIEHPNDNNIGGNEVFSDSLAVFSGSDSSLSGRREGIGVLKMLMVTATSFGYSCAVEFEAIYGIMSLQYFGVPLYLISMPGLVSGSLNCFLVPLLGRISDRGANPLKRKLGLLVFTTACLVIGYTTLGICSWITLAGRRDYGGIPLNNTEVPRHKILNLTLFPSTSNETASDKFNHNGNESIDEKESNAPLLVVSIFSILPFILYDTGYDISIAMSRASVLEVVPAHQRNNVLNMAGMMTGFAGILTAVIGIIDFPKIFGSVFDIDGYALTLILFSVLYGLFGFLTALCSITSMWRMHRDNVKRKQNPGEIADNHLLSQEQNANKSASKLAHTESETFENSKNISTDTHASNKRQYSATPAILSSLTTLSTRSEKPDELICSERNSRFPRNKLCYHTFDYDTSMESQSQHPRNPLALQENVKDHTNQESQTRNSVVDRSQIPTIDIKSKTEEDINDKHPNSTNIKVSENSHTPTLYRKGSLLLSTSKSYESNTLGQIHLQKLRENRQKKSSSSPQTQTSVNNKCQGHNNNNNNSRQSLCNTRFVIALTAIILGTGSVCSTTMYESNTLTMEVYKGEPQALPGTPGRIRYEEGVKMSSIGMLVAYICFLGLFFSSHIIIERFGAVRLFVACNAMVIIGGGLFCVYPSVETYFCLMVTYGGNKFMVMAVVFIIAVIYAPIDGEKNSDGNPSNETSSMTASSASASAKTSKLVGQVMALVAMSTPVGYIFMSIIMGPIMDATGSAMFPIYFCVLTAFGAVVFGIILILMK